MPKFFTVKDKNTSKVYLIQSSTENGAKALIAPRIKDMNTLEWLYWEKTPEAAMNRLGVRRSPAYWSVNFGGGAIPVLDVTNLLRG